MKIWRISAVIAVLAITGAGEASAQNIFQPTGFAGVGTLYPATPLEVVGRFRLSQGSDAAEFFAGSSGGLIGLHIGSRTNLGGFLASS